MQEQDFSSWLTTTTPAVDILSYFPSRELYWLGEIGTPPFCNRPEQPLNSQIMSQAIKRSEAHCKLFDMSEDQDRILFQVIKNRVLQGWYKVAKEETHWDSDSKKMLIWLEWVQHYLFYPYSDNDNTSKYNNFTPYEYVNKAS